MPDITHPEYFRRLARTVGRISKELPRAQHLKRGDDITPAIHTAVSDLGYILAEITSELVASAHYDRTEPAAYTQAERSGTAALTRSAPALGAALGHLAQIVERLGHLHEMSPAPAADSAARHHPHPPGVQNWLQIYLDSTRSNLAAARQQLHKHAVQGSTTAASRTATSPPPGAAVRRTAASR
ncbi:hypothetical protein ACFYVL_09165 [Streptomyces sp. NPDC004111]|uniref:hypothetical protein n=1 Tax=Streptomyces sp. NPDC004111 TaxID=3364690 RepID=UPI0036B12839